MRRNFAYALPILLASLACGEEPPTTAAPGGRGGQAGAGGAEGGSGGQGGDAPFEVSRVVVRLDLRTDDLTTEIHGTSRGPGCVRLRSGPVVRSATWDEDPARFEQHGSDLLVCGPEGVAGAAQLGFEVRLAEARVPGTDAGFWRVADAAARPFTFLTHWVDGCGRLGPCVPGEVHLAHDITVIPRAGDEVLCPGLRSERGEEIHCRVDPAGAYAGFTVAAYAGWEESLWLEHHGVTVRFFEPAVHRVSRSIDRDAAAAAIDALVGWLGPLPYGPELRVGVGPFTWLGYEPPANVFLAQTVGPDVALHVLTHELVHQWAGDRASPAGPHDVVWKEAIAEYLTYRFELSERPAAESERTRRGWERDGLFAPSFPEPLDGTLLGQDLWVGYTSAPMALLLQLEDLLGEDAVADGVARFLSAPGPRTTGELQDSLEQAGGADLDAYWSAWIRGAGEPRIPVLTAAVEQGDLVVTQVQPGSAMPLAVVIELAGEGRTERVKVLFDLEEPPRSVRVPTPLASPEEITIDPDHRLMDLPPL